MLILLSVNMISDGAIFSSVLLFDVSNVVMLQINIYIYMQILYQLYHLN